ncbi:MAG: hypothetical protein ACRCZJ_07640 [Erysipelotrichaceae bacterium]
MEQNNQMIIQALLKSNLSLSTYQQTHKISFSMDDKEEIFSQIGYCNACKKWYHIYDMEGFDVCSKCMHVF